MWHICWRRLFHGGFLHQCKLLLQKLSVQLRSWDQIGVCHGSCVVHQFLTSWVTAQTCRGALKTSVPLTLKGSHLVQSSICCRSRNRSACHRLKFGHPPGTFFHDPPLAYCCQFWCVVLSDFPPHIICFHVDHIAHVVPGLRVDIGRERSPAMGLDRVLHNVRSLRTSWVSENFCLSLSGDFRSVLFIAFFTVKVVSQQPTATIGTPWPWISTKRVILRRVFLIKEELCGGTFPDTRR